MTAAERFLRELDALLDGVEPATRHGLIDELRDELSSLDEEGVDARLRALGDPVHIAATVRAGSSTASHRSSDPRWYAGATVALLTLGGLIVPVIGWTAGLVFLWCSRTWALRHKITGTAIAVMSPLLAAALVMPWSATASDTGFEPASPAALIRLTAFAIVLLAWLGASVWLMISAERRRAPALPAPGV